MTYDLAVWEGDRPADDTTAGQVFTELYNRYIDGEVGRFPGFVDTGCHAATTSVVDRCS